MNKVLARLSIPPRLRYAMLLKEGSADGFDIPNTREGLEFMQVWKETKAPERDAMMKRAYLENVPIHATLPPAEEPQDSEGNEGDSV